jgi:hypothetical protein
VLRLLCCFGVVPLLVGFSQQVDVTSQSLYIVVVCKIVWRRLCHIATLSLMEIELRGMCCDHALLTSLSEPPFKLLLSSSLPVLPSLLHCNAAC